MGRPEKPVDASGGAVADFAGRLRRLRTEAGSPTYRDMAKAAMYSASVLSSAANGHRLPTLQVALAYVAACGGDREEWRRRWLAAAGSGVPVTPPRPAPQSREPESVATPPEPRDAVPALPKPFQLPPRPQGLVGRAEELARLAAAPAGPVVINGPIGVGKSELALHHAHDLAPDMVDGQLYAVVGPVPQGGYDVSSLLGAFLTALGVPAERIPTTVDQRAGLYRSLLVQRRVLVLLEDVYCERQVRPLLVDSPTSTTLVVSRSSLLGLRDVQRVRLEPLPRADSVALIARGLPERAQADPASADRLAGLCGDLPLALDIATRKLLARPELSLRAAVGRLDRPEALLDWLSVGDLSMREILNSAHVQLGDPASDLLDRLAHLPEPELRGDESILAGADQLIDELVEAGMLRTTERFGAYRLDPLARAFVADRDPAHNLLPRRSVPFPRMRPRAGARQLT
ncbi:helix-turn-helix domain-containing protein [Streptomyces sp. NPDC057438]|uniref:helix-turn-helix domain-containing protein n=1 Tax=Streptomyces sp. NPDC057438 TaxID=3346133 RepID=UPI00367699EB